MSTMRNRKQILNFFKQKGRELLPSLFTRVNKKVRKGKKGIQRTDNPQLEAGHRFNGGWRSIRSLRQSSWNAHEVGKRMERILQSTTRDTETERTQEKKRQAGQRTARLARLYDNEDFQLLWKAFQSWEAMSYDDLTKVATRKDQVSIEYYVGFMNGRISVLSDTKDLITRSIIAHKKDAANTE